MAFHLDDAKVVGYPEEQPDVGKDFVSEEKREPAFFVESLVKFGGFGFQRAFRVAGVIGRLEDGRGVVVAQVQVAARDPIINGVVQLQSEKGAGGVVVQLSQPPHDRDMVDGSRDLKILNRLKRGYQLGDQHLARPRQTIDEQQLGRERFLQEDP